MSDSEYLYGYGSRKHIARPNGRRAGTSLESWCGGWFVPAAAMRAIGSDDEALRALPVCQRCEGRAARILQSGLA